MRRSFFPASLSLLLCSALLSGCVVTNDYIAFDSKAAPSPQIKRYDGNEWASERAVMVAAEKTNNWQTVISVGNDVIAKNPTNVEARIYLARAFTKTGDPRQALRVLSFISGVDTAELRIERARALIALTDFEEAVKLLKPLTDGSDLQKLSAEDRRSAKSLAAVAYSMSKNYAAADKLYEELLMDSEQDKMAKTAHNKIFIAPPMQIDLEKFYTDLQRLKDSALHNSDEVVDVLQEMVPTYHPNRRVRADHTVVAATGNTALFSREEIAQKLRETEHPAEEG